MSVTSYLRALEVDREGGPVPDRWINNDIKPIEVGRRTWSFWTFHNFCMSPPPGQKSDANSTPGVLVNSNISGYMTGSSLIALGLTYWQAIIAIVVGELLATMFVVLNSVPGGYYHCTYSKIFSTFNMYANRKQWDSPL